MRELDVRPAYVFDLLCLLCFLQHLASTHFCILHERGGLRIADHSKVFLA